MGLRELKDGFLALPWVYDTLRPLVAGGIDHSALAQFCALRESDSVFDLGCGTAQILPFLKCARYLGADLDTTALERAARHSGPASRFVRGDEWDEALRAFDPTVVLLIGVVHHMPDGIFHSIVTRLKKASPDLREIVTVDVSYFPRRPVNNLLSRLDRGRHVRRPDQYERLFRSAALRILEKQFLSTRLRYVTYIGYRLSHLSIGSR
jgi:SAM-dependent methyltransferase